MKTIVTAVALSLGLALAFANAEARPWRWQGDQRNTYGWQLMSPVERSEHQAKLRSFTEYEACKEYVDGHHKQMEERAREKGVAVPVMRRNPCDTMKARGVLK